MYCTLVTGAPCRYSTIQKLKTSEISKIVPNPKGKHNSRLSVSIWRNWNHGRLIAEREST